jgi:ATP-dependent RNA helicase RhlE
VNTFTELPLSKHLQKQLHACGFEKPTQVQAAAIPHGLSGKDLYATAPTGTGKTLAFILPAMERLLAQKTDYVSILVLVPTRELALQVAAQYEQLAGRYFPEAAVIIGGASENVQIKQLRNGARLVVATPGRLEDLLDRKFLTLSKIEMLVLDEADRMLDMGFLPSIRRIARMLPRKRQTLCFSATADPNVMSVVEDMLHQPVRFSVDATLKAADKVRLTAYEVEQSQKASLLAKVVSEEPGQTLVFVATKRSSERVAKRLQTAGLKVGLIHGDRSQSQRNAALASFQKGGVRVLVATDVASRGIHVDDIALVVNYDLPNIPEDFVHRVGRTGRAGNSGLATTFYTPVERHDVAKLERMLKVKMERLQAGKDLVREERGRKVDASQIRLVTTRSNRVMLEGESLRRYSH